MNDALNAGERKMKITKNDFRQSEECQFCGSQRCDASDEMMKYCWKWIKSNLQGLCKICLLADLCPDARRFLNMIECNMYIETSKRGDDK